MRAELKPRPRGCITRGAGLSAIRVFARLEYDPRRRKVILRDESDAWVNTYCCHIAASRRSNHLEDGARAHRGPDRPPGDGVGMVASLISLVNRYVPEPLGVKVPEIIFLFWVAKILTTAGGEATSDYLATFGNIVGGGTELLLFLFGLALQFRTRKYRAIAYWFFAYSIAIFGTGVADFLHLDVGIPYAGTSLMWAVVLAAVFWVWHHNEGTLSIHSITARRRECYYWATVFATFALGTALGDYTATALGLGFLASGILFGVLILLPALAWWRLGLNAVAAFWFAYVLTRPLGASFADYLSKPRSISGIGFGNGPTALVFTLAVAIVVVYLAIARPDIQTPQDTEL